jgi:hypothetical protein
VEEARSGVSAQVVRWNGNGYNAPAMQKDLLDQQLDANLHGNFEEGWRIAQILERERPHDNRAAFNRGWHTLAHGDLQKGMELMDRGRFEGVFGSPPLRTEKPIWDGKSSLVGKTILLRGEGGFGDEIIHARFAKSFAARGARVILACSPELASLFERVEGVSEVVSRVVPEHLLFDYWVPAMSAARLLGYTYETLPSDPYIFADEEKIKEHALSGVHKVGIRWSGNPRFEHEQHRRFPAEPLFELRYGNDVTLYSLQRDHDLRDLPEGIIDLEKEMATWEDTAGVIANLDLIITSCTSIAHLAAAMGKETWVIVPVLPYYIWAQPGERSAWYKSVRLFRQEQFGEWKAPLVKLARVFEERFGMSGSVAREEILQSHVEDKSLSEHHLHTVMSSSKKKTIHFVAGLPRSGSTVLISLLSQNPRIHGAPISGLAGIFTGIYANWDKSEFHIENPNEVAKRSVLSAVLDAYYAHVEKPIILDKDRSWVSRIALLEDILEREVKIILPVRPIIEILASFETLRLKNPTDLTGADEALGPSSTIAARADYFMSAGGTIGLPFHAMKDAVTSGYLDRLLFVDYNKLMSAPKAQLKRIYEFLEEPYFEHDLERIYRPGESDPRVHKFPGLHDVRPKFERISRNPRSLLGDDVIERYGQPDPWTQWT